MFCCRVWGDSKQLMFALNPVQGTCCSDHIHCCPADTVCDLEHLICKSGKTHFPLLKKITAVPNDGKVDLVQMLAALVKGCSSILKLQVLQKGKFTHLES